MSEGRKFKINISKRIVRIVLRIVAVVLLDYTFYC